MPFPIAIPVAVLAGLGAITFFVTRKKTDSNAEPVPGGGPVGPQGATPTMSPQMRAAFNALLAGSDPAAMETSAAALEPFGFLAEAAQLRARATQLRSAGGSSLPPGFTPSANLQTAPAPTFTPAPSPSPAAAPAFDAFQAAAQDAGAAAALQLTQEAPAAPATLPSFAVVTTSQPAPEGDLMVRPAPNAPGTPGVGAEKGGIVTVINKDVLGDGVWSQVVWGGGPRLGPVSGFVKSQYLRPSSVGPLGTAVAGNEASRVRCVAPSGCRLRKSPSTVSDFRAMVGNGEPVDVLKTVPGAKLEKFSPGRGGWAQVKYKNLVGWLPLEWLARQ